MQTSLSLSNTKSSGTFSHFLLILYSLLFMTAHSAGAQPATPKLARINALDLAKQLKVGDLVFIHVDYLLFRKVSRDTGSWTNHVGIVIDTSGAEPIVAESKIPFSTTTPLSKFIARSKDRRVAVYRLKAPLTGQQQSALGVAALKRNGILYDGGFNLHSRRQFCSRYVYEVVAEATDIRLGKIETLRELLTSNPNADLFFWRIWYLGRIPWNRETVTPASVLHDSQLQAVFDGYADSNADKI